MTDQSAQEPTMEEILASIRRIISEDDAPAETPAAAAPEATPEPVPEPLAAETIFAAPVEPTPEPAPLYAESAPEPAPSYDTLVGDSAAASAASAFAGLAASFKKPEPAQAASGDLPFVSGNTVEAMVAEMLRPLLKDWLDANLPGIVQAAVQKEVERIARSA